MASAGSPFRSVHQRRRASRCVLMLTRASTRQIPFRMEYTPAAARRQVRPFGTKVAVNPMRHTRGF